MGGGPRLTRVLVAALVATDVALLSTVALGGLSSGGTLRSAQVAALVAAGTAMLFGSAGLVLVRLADWRTPETEEDFDALVERAEALAAAGPEAALAATDLRPIDDAPSPPDEFDELVRDALDELPEAFRRALEEVPVVVSRGGRRAGAYGLYHGDTIARRDHADTIVIYRDTLIRDFGHDPERLRAEVRRTVRHELAHHLGWDERGVEDLGL